jgi:UDPglucose 6-dehydrogenase
MKTVVFGTGHVGLVTCVALSIKGHTVVGTDVDAEKIEMIRGGQPWFFEPGLEEALREQLDEGRLTFTVDPRDALGSAQVVFICVGTPPRADGEANLIAVEETARIVARHAAGPITVVEKSTVPAGTAERVKMTLSRERPDLTFEVVSNPEFLREGSGMEDALFPDRILVGAESGRGFQTMRRLYDPWIRDGVRLIETDIVSAELAKHACNAFLALKISYANALARICERAGANVRDVTTVMAADDRIGSAFLNAGIGYGGYCFPKDLVAFEYLANRLGYDFGLLREVGKINDEAVEAVAERVQEALWNLEDKRIALLGLSFKPETDDVRFSPSLALARLLIEKGATVVGYDPSASANARAELPQIEIASDPYEAARGAHCVILGTEWKEFSTLDLSRLRALTAYPVFFDGRNMFDEKQMIRAGFTYVPTGSRPVEPARRGGLNASAHRASA